MKKQEKLGKVITRLTNIFPKKYLFVFGIILTIIISIIQIGFSLILKLLLDATIDKDLEIFYIFFYLLIGFIVFNLFLVYITSRTIGSYTEGGIKTLRNKLTSKMTKIKFEHLSKSHSGDYVSRATNDMNNVRNFTYNTLPELIKQPLLAILALGLLFYFSWKLTLIILITIPILFIVISLLNKPIGPVSKKRQEKLAKANSIATDYIKGVEVSKAYSIENLIKTKYDQTIDETVYFGKRLERRNSVIQSISMILSLTPFFIVFIIGGYFVSENEITIGTLLGFINLLNFVTNPINELPRLISQSIIDKASITRIFEVLNKEEERIDGSSFEFNKVAPVIEFNNVSFSYPGDDNKVLNNLSFIINAEESIALVGPSGGGKSTITKLLLGYYDNYEGEIKVGGHELREWNLNDLRMHMAYVSQDTFLFPESIFENIEYGNSSSSQDEVIESSKLANADNFINEFKDQYQTKVGELGGTLSGGQKQRISIARAIVKNAPILLFDEATSALDNESEALIQKALENTLKNKSSIIVAHRLSTIKNVNKIIVIKGGKNVEEGTHEELINLNENYSHLYNQQFEKNHQSQEGVLNEEEK